MESFYFHTKGLTVGYQGVPLLRDIEIGLRRGEILSLIGPNGAGKTTILKHITRQMKPIAGTVYLNGRALSGISGRELAQMLSVLLTERVRPELMTCEEVVATGRYPYTGKFGILSREDRRVIQESMDLVHIGELASRSFTQTSDGQKQRVMLARAICQQPELLVLDEPTAYLDIRYKIELLDILRNMAKESRLAVVMTLHEIDLATKISDYLLCVKSDGSTFFGSPEQVLASCPIEELYGLEKGSYNALFGSVELKKAAGKPRVFVIGGNGSGIPWYRALQRQQVPFAAGILFENDVDTQVARELSGYVITAPAFEPMTRRQFDDAARCLVGCETVIDAGAPSGSLNRMNGELLSLAKKKGIPVRKELGIL